VTSEYIQSRDHFLRCARNGCRREWRPAASALEMTASTASLAMMWLTSGHAVRVFHKGYSTNRRLLGGQPPAGQVLER